MTYDEVAAVIGPGHLTPPEFVDNYLEWQDDGRWPKGHFERGDRVVQYKCGGRVVKGLQFRNGRLVNFDPTHFAVAD
jgi:hypothetical protein